jgi:hypothetical protein
MISVNTIRKCSFLNSITLEELLRKNYPKDTVIKSEFVGITNAGQFCYQIGYQDPDLKGQGLTFCKVFVHIDNDGNIIADY